MSDSKNNNEDNSPTVTSDDPQLPTDESKDTKSENQKTTSNSNGRGLSILALLLALIALLGLSWIYYNNMFQANETQQDNPLDELASQQDLIQLKQRVDSLEQQVDKHAQRQDQLAQQDRQINQLQQQLAALPDYTFDSTGLEQQIATLKQDIKGLKSQYRESANEPETDSQLKSLARANAVNALKTAQLLIDQQQITTAIRSLKQWRNHHYLPLAIQTRLQQIVTTLSNLETPETNDLNQRLADIQRDIHALELTPVADRSNEETWYDRFISIKKIEPEQQNLNSADLEQIKANASQAIHQAQLALVLKQAEVWRKSIERAKFILADSPIDTKEIENALQQISTQEITIQLPDNLGIDILIQQLEAIEE